MDKRKSKNKAKTSRETLRADIDFATKLYEVAWLSDKSINRTDTICAYLIEKGYGDVKQAVREFAEKLKNKVIEDTAYGCDSNQHTGYYDYTIKIGDIPEYIDELVKEVCGE